MRTMTIAMLCIQMAGAAWADNNGTAEARASGGVTTEVTATAVSARDRFASILNAMEGAARGETRSFADNVMATRRGNSVKISAALPEGSVDALFKVGKLASDGPYLVRSKVDLGPKGSVLENELPTGIQLSYILPPRAAGDILVVDEWMRRFNIDGLAGNRRRQSTWVFHTASGESFIEDHRSKKAFAYGFGRGPLVVDDRPEPRLEREITEFPYDEQAKIREIASGSMYRNADAKLGALRQSWERLEFRSATPAATTMAPARTHTVGGRLFEGAKNRVRGLLGHLPLRQRGP